MNRKPKEIPQITPKTQESQAFNPTEITLSSQEMTETEAS